MPYVAVRLYSLSGAAKAEELAEIALKELAPRLADGPGLIRYTTFTLLDGRVGSFSAYETQDAAKRAPQIAADFVRGHTAFKGVSLSEIMEGDVAYTAEGPVPMTGRLYAVARIYKTDASLNDVRTAFESEGPRVISSFTGLARYTVVKLTDGRVGTFGSFKTREDAAKSSEEAKKVRGTSGMQIARLLPSDPVVLEGVVSGSYAR